jgi:Asp-tRNA(Asn)/Glu-tRNA(Gln) amidotransferase A subunit family amidase
MGSIIVPSLLCGIYGFVPTYGRMSDQGIHEFFDEEGVI